MTVLSLLKAARPSRNVICCFLKPQVQSGQVQQQVRTFQTGLSRFGGGHDRTMVIMPSRFQWQKYKDGLHFYLFLGALPLLGLVFFTNVFIGPATLTVTPENFTPKHWEYYSHPITRFFAKHFVTSLQETYERNLHYIKEDNEEMRLKRLVAKVDGLMMKRGDYPNYYTSKTILGKYMRDKVQEDRYIESITGYTGDR